MKIEFNYPEADGSSSEAMPSAWGTYYYAKVVKPADSGVPLLDMKGNPLGPKLARKTWCLAGIEGTLAIKQADDSYLVYNYAGKKGASQTSCAGFSSLSDDLVAALEKTRWKLAKGPFGDGVGGYSLVPYRTVAVDKTVIPIGTAVYVPEARGVSVKLPDGSKARHDGYFLAADVGGAIKGRHVDFFIGVTEANPFKFATASSGDRFKMRKVTDQTIIKELRSLHRV